MDDKLLSLLAIAPFSENKNGLNRHLLVNGGQIIYDNVKCNENWLVSKFVIEVSWSMCDWWETRISLEYDLAPNRHQTII